MPDPYIGGQAIRDLTLDDQPKFLKTLEERMDGIQRNFDALAGALPGDPNASGSGGSSASPFPTFTLHTTTATTANPTTTSATPATLAEMTITATFSGAPCLVFFSGEFTHSATNYVLTQPELDGAMFIADGNQRAATVATATNVVIAGIWTVTPTQGSHTIDIKWATGGGTATAGGKRRQLLIYEART